MLVPMAKVEVIGPKNRFFDVVSLVHEQGKLHIEDLTNKIASGEMPLDKMEVVAGQQAERDRMEELLIRVRAIIKALHLPGTTIDEAARQKEYLRLWKMDTQQLGDEVASVIQEVEGRTSDLTSSQSSLEGEMELLARYEPILAKIQPLAKQIVTTGAFDSVALLFERRYKGALDQLKEELDRITHKQCEIVSTDVDEDTTAAIVVFNRNYAEPVHKFLAMENVNQIRLPSDMQGLPFDQAYDSIRERRKLLPEQLKAVRLELESMSAKWYLRLATIRDVLTDKIDEIATIPKFGQTEYAFVITGWIPAADLSELEKEMQAAFGMDVIVSRKEITEKDMAETPVALSNPKAVTPFQTLLGVYGTPKYGTMDPTWALFAFFPIFFGLIVGDIGYGLIYLGVVLWLRNKMKDNEGVQIATSIFGPAATMCIVFGFFYGEFFGNVLGKHMLNLIVPINHIGPIPLPFFLPFNREELYMGFMFLALAVGVIQILLGLTMGVITAIKTKNKHHLQMRGGILTLLVAVGIAVVFAVVGKEWGTIGLIGQFTFAAIAFGGFIFALRGGGVMGAVETLESVTHIASYIRIMAVGLGGAIFASAINGIVVNMSAGGGAGIIIAIVLGLVLHSLNILLSAFSPSIHALRLNFLEFFGKFFEAGNTEYSPFRKTGGEGQA
jgi:V/A-type H+-transporting ATPase subunit I